MDPLQPITYGPAPPSRRVPPVDRLRPLSREGDRPPRKPSERREADEREPPRREQGEEDEGHIDIKV